MVNEVRMGVKNEGHDSGHDRVRSDSMTPLLHRGVRCSCQDQRTGVRSDGKFPNLSMEQHLTVREAKAFVGKSESTIKRLIREIVGDPEHGDRGLILPSPEEVGRRKSAGDTFVWKLNRDLLTRRFPKDADNEEGNGGTKKSAASATGDTADSTPIIQVLREQLQSKDRQLQTLETQLDRKDEQIKSLNDRMHESNVLMGELQRRLTIAAPVSNKSEPINAESANDAVNDNVDASKPQLKQNSKPSSKSKQDQKSGRELRTEPTRRSFFGNLFRRRS